VQGLRLAFGGGPRPKRQLRELGKDLREEEGEVLWKFLPVESVPSNVNKIRGRGKKGRLGVSGKRNRSSLFVAVHQPLNL